MAILGSFRTLAALQHRLAMPKSALTETALTGPWLGLAMPQRSFTEPDTRFKRTIEAGDWRQRGQIDLLDDYPMLSKDAYNPTQQSYPKDVK
jgi:hypothetical protein